MGLSRRYTIKKTEIMKLSITLIAIVGSLLCISPIFGEDVQCKSNQECIKLRDCPYTKKLLTTVLSSSDIEESEAEAEAEGNHEVSDAKAMMIKTKSQIL